MKKQHSVILFIILNLLLFKTSSASPKIIRDINTIEEVLKVLAEMKNNNLTIFSSLTFYTERTDKGVAFSALVSNLENWRSVFGDLYSLKLDGSQGDYLGFYKSQARGFEAKLKSFLSEPIKYETQTNKFFDHLNRFSEITNEFTASLNKVSPDTTLLELKKKIEESLKLNREFHDILLRGKQEKYPADSSKNFPLNLLTSRELNVALARVEGKIDSASNANQIFKNKNIKTVKRHFYFLEGLVAAGFLSLLLSK